MAEYIESCLSLYDLKLDGLVFETKSDQPYYFCEKEFSGGLKFKCRSDAYYVFDFSKSPIGESVEYQPSSVESNLYIHNQRVEVLHAFLACLRSEYRKKTSVRHSFDMDFIDHFIVCLKNQSDLDILLDDKCFNQFSSEEYRKLCCLKYQKLSKANKAKMKPFNYSEVVCDALSQMEAVIQRNPFGLYVLGVLYRVAVYHKLGLEMHTVSFLKSVFEWIVKNFPAEGIEGKTTYDKFLNQSFLGLVQEEKDIMASLKDLRDDALHDLTFPKTKFLGNPISKAFCAVQKIFNKIFDVNISIPFGQGQIHLIEHR